MELYYRKNTIIRIKKKDDYKFMADMFNSQVNKIALYIVDLTDFLHFMIQPMTPIVFLRCLYTPLFIFNISPTFVIPYERNFGYYCPPKVYQDAKA